MANIIDVWARFDDGWWWITESPQSRRISGEAIQKRRQEIYHDTKENAAKESQEEKEKLFILKGFLFKDIALLQTCSCTLAKSGAKSPGPEGQ